MLPSLRLFISLKNQNQPSIVLFRRAFQLSALPILWLHAKRWKRSSRNLLLFLAREIPRLMRNASFVRCCPTLTSLRLWLIYPVSHETTLTKAKSRRPPAPRGRKPADDPVAKIRASLSAMEDQLSDLFRAVSDIAEALDKLVSGVRIKLTISRLRRCPGPSPLLGRKAPIRAVKYASLFLWQAWANILPAAVRFVVLFLWFFLRFWRGLPMHSLRLAYNWQGFIQLFFWQKYYDTGVHDYDRCWGGFLKQENWPIFLTPWKSTVRARLRIYKNWGALMKTWFSLKSEKIMNDGKLKWISALILWLKPNNPEMPIFLIDVKTECTNMPREKKNIGIRHCKCVGDQNYVLHQDSNRWKF